MKIREIISERAPSQGWKAYCTNTPANKMSNSWLSSCKSRGLKARSTSKSQKIGNKRVKLDNKRIKGVKHGGPVSAKKTG